MTISENARVTLPSGRDGRHAQHGPPGSVCAVVLTHRRPRLATMTVKHVLDAEGLAPDDVILVVNGEGGLDDQDLEDRVRVLRLPRNLGPAGGYRAGLVYALERTRAGWVYLLEDDAGLLSLPAPRVLDLASELARGSTGAGFDDVGAVVAYGRTMDPKTGATVPLVPRGTRRLEPVDVAAWGATLLSRRALRAGILPDDRFFFGYEDFDFFLRLRAAGFRVLLDTRAAAAVATEVTDLGRARRFRGERPADDEEPWRRYYQARNFLELRRRHGRASWVRSHLVKSVRRWQLAGSWESRRAIAWGLIDGWRGRLGPHPGFMRGEGEVRR